MPPLPPVEEEGAGKAESTRNDALGGESSRRLMLPPVGPSLVFDVAISACSCAWLADNKGCVLWPVRLGAAFTMLEKFRPLLTWRRV